MSENEDFSTNNVFTDEAKPEKKKKKHIGLKIFLIILLCLIIGFPAYYGGRALYREYSPSYSEGGIGGLANAIIDGKPAEDAAPIENNVKLAPQAEDENAVPTPAPAIATPSTNANDADLSPEEVFEQNVNSVVSISTTVEGYNYFGQKVQGAASGSGFIVTEDGYILTNYHVIEDSTAITVITYSGDEYEATLRGYDKSNDIAVLKVDADNLKPVNMGDSDKLKEGQRVVAIGNALGEFGFSITEGIISGLARDVQVDKNLTMSLIQTDCAINSGNSGGPLFNMKGQVIGITNAKLSSSGTSTSAAIDNIGFAIPINSVYEIVLTIIENGGDASYVSASKTPFLGITGSDLSEEMLSVTGLKGGAIVTMVYEGSAAETAGIKTNDIILKANKKEITDFNSLKSVIAELNVGDEVEFEIYRSGKTSTVKATLTSMNDVDTSVEEDTNENAYGNDNNNQQWGNQMPGEFYGDFGDFGSLFDYFYGFNQY